MANDKPLKMAVGALALPLLLIPLLKLAKVDSDLIGPASTSVVGAFELWWLRRLEDRKTRAQRIREAKAGQVGGSPLPQIVAVGVAATGLITGVQFILSLVASETLEMGLRLGAIQATGRATTFNADLQAFLAFLWVPISVVLAIPLARFAAHRLGARPFIKMLWSLPIALLLVTAINVAFTISAAEALGVEPLTLMARSIGTWTTEAGRVLLVLIPSFLLGSIWAQKTQDAFMGRLMARTLQEDRTAILELLGQTPESKPA